MVYLDIVYHPWLKKKLVSNLFSLSFNKHDVIEVGMNIRIYIQGAILDGEIPAAQGLYFYFLFLRHLLNCLISSIFMQTFHIWRFDTQYYTTTKSIHSSVEHKRNKKKLSYSAKGVVCCDSKISKNFLTLHV